MDFFFSRSCKNTFDNIFTSLLLKFVKAINISNPAAIDDKIDPTGLIHISNLQTTSSVNVVHNDEHVIAAPIMFCCIAIGAGISAT